MSRTGRELDLKTLPTFRLYRSYKKEQDNSNEEEIVKEIKEYPQLDGRYREAFRKFLYSQNINDDV